MRPTWNHGRVGRPLDHAPFAERSESFVDRIPPGHGTGLARGRLGKMVACLAAGVAAVAVGAALVWWLAIREPALRIDAILAVYDETKSYGSLRVVDPPDGVLFPPEIAPPTFRWEDVGGDADAWLVTIRFQDNLGRMSFASSEAQWTPSAQDWETIKRRSQEKKARVTVLGVRRGRQEEILSSAGIAIASSRDPVGAPLFYREVNLPFSEAAADPSRIRWRFGEISSTQPPPVVLGNLPVCGNCHSFSADGKTMGMDVDYANDKGSYAIAPVAEETLLEPSKIVTWSDYRREDHEPTFGLLSQVSPDGRYVVSTVKDRSVFVPKPGLAYSQLFFPIKGILAVYCRRTRAFQSLPGADDPQYVQSNPVWSPDGKYIVFARSRAYRLQHVRDTSAALLTAEECREFLAEGRPFRFDLYRIPFDEGRGGKAEPLAGASGDGMSNYFPKYSPDGKWIVFCKAKTFMLLQPDSALYIIPAGGGESRRLGGNTGQMNSWHSWSPNSRWLVFSSKAFSPYTQLFLTHIDQQGRSSPAVLLSRLTSPDRAANIPEFVNIKPGGIGAIRARFLDDYSYARLAGDRLRKGDFDGAEAACRKALELNPKSAAALCNLGIALAEKGKIQEAQASYLEAIRHDPGQENAHLNLAILLSAQQKRAEALVHYREAARIRPDLFAAHFHMALDLLELGRVPEAIEPLSTAARLRPDHAEAQFNLALALHSQDRLDQALLHYRAALQAEPDHIAALVGMARLRATSKDPALRNGTEAVTLARRACQLTQFSDATALVTLAAAHAETRRYADAAATAERALAIAHRGNNATFIRMVEQSLEDYRQKERQSRSPQR